LPWAPIAPQTMCTAPLDVSNCIWNVSGAVVPKL
jgi:hypothetical protein